MLELEHTGRPDGILALRLTIAGIKHLTLLFECSLPD